ncbi:4-hydroxy-2-oxovalerate aldolase [Facklamia lactis]|uniref:4-hydroxy-2-oxovalerate aldolase n=1 Tax=Facklamia lactis TaxID=2749967 RepID=UPI0018CFE007|nr:4-hydroxy-2-oxovalerate aldolase [Facklamia lactis]MBG9980333.1 4-hydroxy-2-oxovalerate aldolase [Facklamia lactis]
MTREVTVVEVALRDGSHAVKHQYTKEQVAEIVKGLDGANIPYIEVSHGDGIGGSSIQYGYSKVYDIDLIRIAKENATHSKIACLLLPGVGTVEDLKQAHAAGAEMVRVATHCTEADVSKQHIKFAKEELHMEVVGFLMMSHMVSPKKLLEQARLMESYGADVVYVTDSAGALLPDGVYERVHNLVINMGIPIGFHAHNNLGLAMANTISAYQAGASFLDGSARALGAGAGNTQTEVMIAVLDKMGVKTGVDLYKMMDVAEDIMSPMMTTPQIIDRNSITLGYAGVYSSFNLHAKRAAEQFGLDARDLLVECGKRKTVGGQEDIIFDVAAEMAHKNNS